MQLDRNGTLPTVRAPEQNFSGDVFVSDYFSREAPSRVAGAAVTFTPGSRTPWKTNPLGQTLIVTSGIGWAQCEGGPVVEIRPGDVVWCPPGKRHWDGATPDHGMSYIAVHETEGGRAVEFHERVTDAEYRIVSPLAS